MEPSGGGPAALGCFLGHWTFDSHMPAIPNPPLSGGGAETKPISWWGEERRGVLGALWGRPLGWEDLEI